MLSTQKSKQMKVESQEVIIQPEKSKEAREACYLRHGIDTKIIS